MKIDALKNIVSERELEQIAGTVKMEDVIAVLRWIERSLQLEQFIQ